MRITINLSEEILKKVDARAKSIGTTRGAMLTTWIGEKLRADEQLQTMMEQLLDNPLTAEVMKDAYSKKER